MLSIATTFKIKPMAVNRSTVGAADFPNMAHKIKLLDLPDELLCMVAETAGKDDLRALKLTCVRLRKAAKTPYEKEFFTERRHVQTLASLQDLVAITAHPEFGRLLQSIHLSAVDSIEPHPILGCRMNPEQQKAMRRIAEERRHLLRGGQEVILLEQAFRNIRSNGIRAEVGVFETHLADGYGGKSWCEQWLIPCIKPHYDSAGLLARLMSAIRNSNYQARRLHIAIRDQPWPFTRNLTSGSLVRASNGLLARMGSSETTVRVAAKPYDYDTIATEARYLKTHRRLVISNVNCSLRQTVPRQEVIEVLLGTFEARDFLKELRLDTCSMDQELLTGFLKLNRQSLVVVELYGLCLLPGDEWREVFEDLLAFPSLEHLEVQYLYVLDDTTSDTMMDSDEEGESGEGHNDEVEPLSAVHGRVVLQGPDQVKAGLRHMMDLLTDDGSVDAAAVQSADHTGRD